MLFAQDLVTNPGILRSLVNQRRSDEMGWVRLCEDSYSDMYSVWIQWKLTTRSTCLTSSPFHFSFPTFDLATFHTVSTPVQFTPISIPPSPTFGSRLSLHSPASLMPHPSSPAPKAPPASPISQVSATASPRSPNTNPSSALGRVNPRNSSRDS